MIKHLSLLRINFSTLFPTFSFASQSTYSTFLFFNAVDKQTMKLRTALRLKLENFLYWSWTLGTFNSLILRLDWKQLELTLPAKETRPDGITNRQQAGHTMFVWFILSNDFWFKLKTDGDLLETSLGLLVMSQVRGCKYILLWKKILSAALGHAVTRVPDSDQGTVVAQLEKNAFSCF